MPKRISHTSSPVYSEPAAAPRRTVVPQQTIGQAIQAKSLDQMSLNRSGLLVGTGRQQHVVTGVIIQPAQRITTPLPQREMTL